MSHERDLLHLDPAPSSAGRARAVVSARLHDIGREDLVDSASLVVSELVTNALLHAGAPITLRVRGTSRRPRIEVGDTSMMLPRLPEQITEPGDEADLVLEPEDTFVLDDLLVTYGRGVRLVQIHSAAWGVDRTAGAKVVWFEPSVEALPCARNEIQVFEIGDLDSVPQQGRRPAIETPTAEEADPAAPSPTADSDHRRVRLLSTPVRLLDSVRRHYDELQREIRLIGLQYGRERSALRRELFEQAARPDLHRLRAIGTEQLVDAVVQGRDHADLDYLVTPADAEEFRHTVELLLEADEFCQHEKLLTLALTDEQLEALRWFCDQVVAQVHGAAPTPWCTRAG